MNLTEPCVPLHALAALLALLGSRGAIPLADMGYAGQAK